MNREQFVDCRGLNIHIMEWGPPDRPTLLLHHGFLDHARSWDPVAAQLSQGYRVLALDARGHGDSDWISGGGYYFFQDYVSDVADVVDRLVKGPLVLVGHSMGGMVCSLYAGTFPDRVSGLVSIEGAGPPGLDPSDAPALMEGWISGVRKARSKAERPFSSVEEAAQRLRAYNPGISEAFSLHLAEHGTRPTENGKGRRWKFDPLHRTRGPQPFYVKQARAFWARISSPTLIVHGESSPMKWDPSEQREDISGARTAVIPQAGHMVHHDQPERLTTAILSFLKENGI